MKFGYARNLDTQIEALKKEGCDKIIEEKKSAKDLDRPELNRLLDDLRDGDTLVVYDLSRLSRSIADMISLVENFNQRNIKLISLKDGYDASNIFSKYILIMLSMVNDIQRTFQREKILEGMAIAKANGRVGGRTPISDEKKKMIWNLIKGGTSYTKTAEALKVSRMTVANVVKEFKKKEKDLTNELNTVLEDFIIPDRYSGMKLSDIDNKDDKIEKGNNTKNISNIKSRKEEVPENQISLYDILDEGKEDYDDYDDEYDSTNFNFGDDDY